MNNRFAKGTIVPFEEIFACHTIAMVGLSDKPHRPSFRVASYLRDAGYRVIPVNPQVDCVLGEKSFPDLTSIPDSVEGVCTFRRSEEVPDIVDAALKLKGLRYIWMQEGVVHHPAGEKAGQAGLIVVMDHCIMVEHMSMREI